MNHDLFRKESLDANKTKVLGPVALYCPLPLADRGDGMRPDDRAGRFCSLGSYTNVKRRKGY
jgi:membrane fusion protein